MNNIVLLGHGVGVKFVIESLLKNFENYKVVALVTHPYEEHKYDLELVEQRKDMYGKYSYNVFNVERDYNVNLLEANDVNDENTISWISKFNPELIISIGCRNILKKIFLSKFKNKVFNIHTTPLPRYRGGASDSWMILNDELGKELYGCFHYIDAGIDTGDIVAKSHYTLPKKAYPIDVFKVRMDVFHDILVKAIRKLEDQKFIPEKQDHFVSTTFPRLYTPKDGRIMFERFSGKELELFVYAFGYPFEGAFCYLENTKINILEVEFRDDIKLHGFSLGLIFSRNEKGEYKISVNGGYIIVKRIEINGEPVKQSKFFRLGKYLH